MKVAFHTLGCKVNSYESQAMLNMFEEAGYEEVDFKEVADVYVVNTCTVTNTGDSKSRQMIRKAIRKNPQATVCVVGCYSQVAPQDIEAIEGVSIILGTQFRNEIVDLVEKYQQTHERIVKVSEVKQLRKFEDLNIDRFLHTRAYLKIQDGCNNFCTYCIIPYARGRVRSRKPESPATLPCSQASFPMRLWPSAWAWWRTAQTAACCASSTRATPPRASLTWQTCR